MKTAANRSERIQECIAANLLYLRRAHPGETPELVIVNEGLEWYVKLTEAQFVGLVRDGTGMFFAKTMQP